MKRRTVGSDADTHVAGMLKPSICATVSCSTLFEASHKLFG